MQKMMTERADDRPESTGQEPADSADHALLKLIFKLGGVAVAVVAAAALVVVGLFALWAWKMWSSGTLVD